MASYWIIETIPALGLWRPDWKRYLAYALTGIISIGAYLAQVGLRYAAAPVGAQGWAEVLFAVAMTAFGVSQIPHAIIDLRKRE